MVSVNQDNKQCKKIHVGVEPFIRLEFTVTVLDNLRLELVFKKIPEFCDDAKPKSETYLRLTAPRFKTTGNDRKLPIGHVTTIEFSQFPPGIFEYKSTIQRDIKTGIRLLGLKAIQIEVLDKYLLYLFTQQRDSKKNYKYLSPLFMPDWRDSDRNRKSKFKDMDFQIKHMPNEPINNVTFIAPVYAFRHFYLTVFDFQNKNVNIYDSMWTHIRNEQRLRHVSCLIKILTIKLQMQMGNDNLHETQKWSVILNKECAQQDDEQKCGYFVVYFIESILKGRPQNCFKKPSPKVLLDLRNKMFEVLLCKTEIGKQIFKACSI